MPSPFPGMDPYLEWPEGWSSLHGMFLVAVVAQLNRRLPPEYAATFDHYVWLTREPGGRGVPFAKPDVTLSPRWAKPTPQGGAAVLTATAAEATEPTAEATLGKLKPIRKSYVKIMNARSREVFTVLELLSPANKAAGEGRTAYLAKRKEYLAARVNLLEIDLLRTGSRLPLGKPLPPASDYLIALCPADRPSRVLIWAFDVRDPIPVVPVPFESGVAAVTLDLRACLDRAYDEGRYAGQVRYDAPADPPLRKLDAAWAAALLAGRAAT